MYDDKQIIKMYQEGIKITHIMKRTNYSYMKIKRILVENNVFVQKGNPNSGRKRTDNANDDFFETIDTAEKAYWLGFIWGDGYITNGSRTLGIALGIVDIGHLEKFKQAIKFTGKIGVYKITSGWTDGEYCRILLNSKKMISDLKRHGLQEKKSLIMLPPISGSIPENLQSHFVRGLQDANGSLCGFVNKYGKQIYYIHILGTLDILEYIKSIVGYETKQKYGQRKEGCPVYNCRFNLNSKNMWMLEKIYADSYKAIRLDRKYEKYIEIKQFFKK